MIFKSSKIKILLAIMYNINCVVITHVKFRNVYKHIVSIVDLKLSHDLVGKKLLLLAPA